jgi:DNA-nicking Smr family endonuclease
MSGPADDEPVIIPIEDFLDLHSFSPKEVIQLIDEYFFQCQERGFQRVRLIHGRGTGTLRRTVRDHLAKDPRVLEFRDAAPEAGGWGATLVYLKSKLSK